VIYVKVYNNNIEKALSKFKKKLMVELREREFYTKKSLKRKEQIAKAKLRRKNRIEN